jgi:hypothetical protein
MSVLLTSFKRYHDDIAYPYPTMPGYSIAVYQPSWYEPLPKLDLFDIRRHAGTWTRPRDFITVGHDPAKADSTLLRAYHDTLLTMYRDRYAALKYKDLGELAYNDVALCCWCPYDKAAKRQLDDYGSFVCHSWVVESFLKELGVKVVRDLDRKDMVR